MEERTLTVDHLRGVAGGHYAGGFFGLAQVGSVAEVGGSQEGSGTSVLDLIKLGNVSLLDIFRTYIYHASVTGVEDGIMIYAHDAAGSGNMSTYQESGAAGGFGGGLMNGTVEHSSVSGLNFVHAPNYAGGFGGIFGTSSGIGTDDVNVAGDTQANLELLNVVGSTLTHCAVDGFGNGFIVRTTNRQTANGQATDEDVKGSCAAGFAGYSDMAQMDDCTVRNFKYAKSPQIAGGFVGRSALNYLVDLDVNSPLTGVVVRIVNGLVKALYLDEAQRADVIHYDSNLAGLKLLSDGDLLYVNLLGLKIGASLSKNDPEYGGASDAAIVTIGSSTVKLPCDENGLKNSPDISVTLIEGNRTHIQNSGVKGVEDGYDVFGGGADDNNDGTDTLGYAGGFIGYNDGGSISDSSTELCDVVRGTADKVGPFVGATQPRRRTAALLEGTGNHFHIYREDNGGYTTAKKGDSTPFATADETKETLNNIAFNRYDVTHLSTIKTHADLDGAVESGSANADRALEAYASPAMAVLMRNTPLDDNGVGDTPITSDLKDPCDEEFDLTVNKIWKDFLLFASRPDSITVKIAQVEWGATSPPEMIAAGVPKENQVVKHTYNVTIDSSDGSTWSSSWQKIVENLPVADRQTVNGTETVVYYQYLVQEIEVQNYGASYQTEQSTATATITNRYNGPLLPTTGGPGTLAFYAAGMCLIICGGVLLLLRLSPDKKKRQQKKSASSETMELSAFSDFLRDRK